MSRKSKRRNQALALIGAAALASRMRPSVMSGDERRDLRKTKVGSRNKKDTMNVGKTMVGSPVLAQVDYDANPRERADVADKARKVNTRIRKEVEKRRDDGELSPTMPKRKNQVSSDFGLGIADGAKKGKMIRARGGGIAIQGMKPTKLY